MVSSSRSPITRSAYEVVFSPTAKPTHVIVHRIELQKTEREILEGVALASGAGAILSGVGDLLNPFGRALGLIVAAWIAKDGIEGIVDWANKKMGEKDRRLASDYVKYLEAYHSANPAYDREMFPDKPAPKPPMTEKEYNKKFNEEYETNWDQFLNYMSDYAERRQFDTGD